MWEMVSDPFLNADKIFPTQQRDITSSSIRQNK